MSKKRFVNKFFNDRQKIAQSKGVNRKQYAKHKVVFGKRNVLQTFGDFLYLKHDYIQSWDTMKEYFRGVSNERILKDVSYGDYYIYRNNIIIENPISQVLKINNKLTNGQLDPGKNYIDATSAYKRTASPNSHEVEYREYFESNGKIYYTDGVKNTLKPSKEEIIDAEWLKEEFGGQIALVPIINEPPGTSTPDYIFRYCKWDRKGIFENGPKTIINRIKNAKEQASNFLVNITKSSMSMEDAEVQIIHIYADKDRSWVNYIILKKGELYKIYRRK